MMDFQIFALAVVFFVAILVAMKIYDSILYNRREVRRLQKQEAFHRNVYRRMLNVVKDVVRTDHSVLCGEPDRRHGHTGGIEIRRHFGAGGGNILRIEIQPPEGMLVIPYDGSEELFVWMKSEKELQNAEKFIRHYLGKYRVSHV
jgi:hypothetical protein